MTKLIGVIQKERYTMENKIINPMEQQLKEQFPLESKIRNMNQTKGDVKGEWVYSQEHGIVWKPTPEDLMGGTPSLPTPPTPPSLLTDLVQWGKTLDLDNIKPNSVMVIKLNSQNSVHAQQMQQGIVNMVLAPRAEKLKDKRLTVLFMASDDNIELIDEQEMESAGWKKKEKLLITDIFNR
jgi:hypothetical protein